MSYRKSTWGEQSSVAHFYFPGFKELHIKLEDKDDMRRLEEMFDYCTKLGAEQALQNADR